RMRADPCQHGPLCRHGPEAAAGGAGWPARSAARPAGDGVALRPGGCDERPGDGRSAPGHGTDLRPRCDDRAEFPSRRVPLLSDGEEGHGLGAELQPGAGPGGMTAAMAAEGDKAAVFERHRRRLFSLAYRMLGLVGDAEDAVQDAYLRWHRTDVASIQNPAAW